MSKLREMFGMTMGALPEPGPWLMLASGIAFLLGLGRWRLRSQPSLDEKREITPRAFHEDLLREFR